MKKDINTRADIVILIDAFYTKVAGDELLAPVFSGIDLPAHMPVMYNFWASMLLGERTYQGNQFQKHVNLPIEPKHFTRWLQLFGETLDSTFEGAKANEAKQRAQSIALLFQHKLGLIN